MDGYKIPFPIIQLLLINKKNEKKNHEKIAILYRLKKRFLKTPSPSGDLNKLIIIEK